MKIYISTIFRVWTPTTNQNTIIYKTHILFWIITSLFSFYKQLPTRCIIIKYVIFKLLIFIPFWTERQEQNENSSHIHEKYSLHHPQIILPLSVAYTGTYQLFCVTLTIPLPSPLRQENVVYKRFPLSSASPSFSSLLNREQDLVSPAWRAPQCGCTPGRDRFRITHTRDSQSSSS